MGLIPKRVKDLFSRRSASERNGMTMLGIAEAQRWDEAREAAEQFVKQEIVRQNAPDKAQALAKMEQAGFKLGSSEKTMLAAAYEMLTAGKVSEETRLAAEAVAPQLFTLTTGDGEDPGFRRITSLATLRDLNPLMHDRMLQVCYFLFVTTPFGKRIVEILAEYALGKGLTVTAKDPRVQKVIDDFWKDDVNRMDENVEQWFNELTIFGELCTPVAVNPVSGRVRMGYIDPMNIDTIQFAEMATSDGTASINVPFAVRVRREVGEVLQKPMLLIRRVEDPNQEKFGRLDGECFYWTLNKVKSASRGFSEIFALADWLDLFDQMIFDFGDKVRFLNSFVWHYIFEGADEKKVAEYKDKLTKDPPKQGGVLVTNEKIKVEAQTPDFKGQDMAAGAQMVKKYGSGGAGIPLVLLGDGDDANRASATEMNAPFTKKIQRRQNGLARSIEDVLDFVIECAQNAGVLPMTVDTDFSVQFPEVAVKDLEKGAQTLQGTSIALSTATQEGWITGRTAAKAFHTLLAEMGVDIEDSNEEYEAAQQEKADRQTQQQEAFMPQSYLSKALKTLAAPDASTRAGTGQDDELIDEGNARNA
jgi:hypothetical protein